MLQDRYAYNTAHHHYVNRFEATSLLQQANDGPLSDAQKAAVQRLNDMQTAPRWGLDTIFKIFNDLDLLLFRRKLKGNVYLRWDNEDEDMNGPDSSCLGITTYFGPHGPRCRIELSMYHSTLATVGLRDVLSTLVHEMVHAYLVVVTNQDAGDSDRRTAMHGNSFNKCGKAVLKRLGAGFKDILDCPDIWSRRVRDPRWRSGFRFVGERHRRSHGGRRHRQGW